jgi:hypothetical protein
MEQGKKMCEKYLYNLEIPDGAPMLHPGFLNLPWQDQLL